MAHASAFLLLGSCFFLTFLPGMTTGQAAGPYPPELTGGPLYVDYNPSITSDKQFVSQLVIPTPPPGQNGYTPGPTGGSYVNAQNSKAFPAVEGMGLSTAYFALNPCGSIPPHHHPRAAEIAVVVIGKVLFVFVDTNNTAHYMLVPAGSQVLLPPALPHMYQEYANAPATIISAFSNENPGAVLMAPAMMQFPEGIVRAALGLPNAAAVASLNATVPSGFVTIAPDACTTTGAGRLG